jgi:hypothetical protein
MVKSYYSCFYRYELRSMSELHRRRDLFKRRIARLSRLSAEELFLAGGLAQVADIMLDLSELRMAVGY